MARARIGKSTPQEAGRSWNQGFSAGAEAARKTVDSGNVDWATPTLNAEQRIASGIAQAFSGGRWRSGVQGTGNGGWLAAMKSKGIPHMAQGSADGEKHYATFRAAWDGFVQQAKSSLPARGSYEQNKQRSSAMQDAFHQARGKYKGLWKRGGGV